jgi:sulfur carrier protein
MLGAVTRAGAPDPGLAHRRDPIVMNIVVNGERHDIAPGATVADLVTTWCSSPDGIAVARNREVVPRSEWATTSLTARDTVEIVTAAAGG